MRRSHVARIKRIQPINRLFGRALDSAFAFVFGIERMKSKRKRCDLREAEQDLVEQMRATFGKGNAEQDGPAALWRGHRCKANALKEFFGLVNYEAHGRPQRHSVNYTSWDIFHFMQTVVD